MQQCCRVAGIRAAATLVVLDVARAFQVTRIKVECCGDERFVKARRVNPKNFFAELKRRNVYKVADRLRSRGMAVDAGRDAGFSVLRNSELGRAARCAACRDRFPGRADSRLGV